jgi:hypothetical protein
LNFILNEIKRTCYYEIFDDVKTLGSILDIIKTVIDYKGDIIFDNIETIKNRPVAKLDFNYKHDSLIYSVRKIYNYLLSNSDRFRIY